MKAFIVTILGLLFFLFIGIIAIRFNGEYYKSKFDRVNVGTHISNVQKDWGSPDDEFFYTKQTHKHYLKYRKDLLGWDTYIFIFDENKLLTEKFIDD